MTAPLLSISAQHCAPSAPGASPTARRATAALAALACLGLGWVGGPAGLAGALAAALLLPRLLPGLLRTAAPAASHPAPDAADAPALSGGRVGAEVMVGQVVPVWGQQLALTHQTTADGLGQLLQSFGLIAAALTSLGKNLDNFSPSVDAGAIDAALGSQAAALAALLAPSQRAFAQRDAAVAELVNCADALEELRQIGRVAREIGKHTRLVAFNATIEAQRGGVGSGAGGSQGGTSGALAIAHETRALAARMAEVGEQIERLVQRLDHTLTRQRLRGEIDDTTPEELTLELDLRAREALAALLGAMDGALHASGDIKTACQTLFAQVNALFVHLQFGDRISQTLGIVAADMQHFARWVAANPYASQSDAADWLAQLQARYMTEEQRAQHHGNVHVSRGSEIELF